jgi:O-Antigen ligase
VTLPTKARASRWELARLTPAAILLALVMVWIGASGGYSPETWYPSALGALALAAVVIAWGRRALPDAKPARVALLAFAGLVAFNYLSILWAASPGNALDASNKLALYLLVAWVFSVLPWTPRGLAALLGLWSVGVGVFCAIAVIRATSATNLTDFFIDGRFATPMQYSNATGALAVMAVWPALILSSRRELPFWLRGFALGIAVFLADFSTLPQSRAVLLGLALTTPIVLIVSSDRLRVLVRMLVVGGALAVVLPRTVDVDEAVNAGRRVAPVLRHAADGMLLTSIAALLIGVLLGAIENRRRDRRPERTPVAQGQSDPVARSRFAIPRAYAAAVGVLVAVIAAAAIAEPKIAHLAHTVVKNGNTDAAIGSNRLISTSPEERFDYARVALHLFSAAPIVGIGDGNFGRDYDSRRRFVKHSQYTHNLPLRVLAETGIVGMALFLSLVAALVVGMIQVARTRTDLGRAGAASAFAVAGYFLVHSCLDWVDQFPALAVPAIAFPLAVLALSSSTPAPEGAGVGDEDQAPKSRFLGHGTAGSRIAGAVGLVAGLGLFVALAASYLSLRYVDHALVDFRAHPQVAFHDLSLARSLNPLSVNALTSEGTIALYLGDTQRSEAAFTRSVSQEDDWYPRLELALMNARAGRFPEAARQLSAAKRLDANDPLLDEARAKIAQHVRIDPIAFNRQLAQEGNAGGAVQQTIR